MKANVAITALIAHGAFASAIPASSHIAPRQSKAGCDNPVVLDATTNIFRNYALHPHTFWKTPALAAANKITEPKLKEQVLKAADLGTFLWIENATDIPKIEKAVKDVPCNHVLGLVLASLPYKNCPSIGFPPVSDPWSYEDKILKPIVQVIKANSNIPFVIIVEPDVMGVFLTNAKLNSCQHISRSYRQNVPLALKGLDLPNVITYLDAAHGGWLGWQDNQMTGAKEIADTWRNAGVLKQFRGISLNVGSYNSWNMVPGEKFEGEDPSEYVLNPARNEQIYLNIIQQRVKEYNVTMPLYGIMDTSRNGVSGIRREWGDWCNVNGAGFGPAPSWDTKDSNLDAFVWAKQGGVSDGTTDTSAVTYDSFCGKADAFRPMPQRGEFSQAYFEMLVRGWKGAPKVSRSLELKEGREGVKVL